MRLILARHLINLLLCCMPVSLLAAPANQMNASYDVIGFGMKLANVTESFTYKDNAYQVTSITKAVGMLARFKPETVTIMSQGTITQQGLKPSSYSLNRLVDTHKNASANFNWDKSILTHNDYKGVNDYPLTQGTQDRLSVLYHLPLLVKSSKTDTKFDITDGNNLENYRFTLAPETQKISIPMGEFATRYISSTVLEGQIRYEIWMAIDRDYFPIKVIVTDSSGGKLTQVLTDLTITQ